MTNSPIRHLSDTARWAAFYRARESERPDAIFRDPFADRLAGDLGEQIARAVKFSTKNSWSWVARTYLFDQFLNDCVKQGCDMVVNLAAGLDARPFRMNLPPTLKWVEVDLPEVIDYKADLLASEVPTCSFERIASDLSSVSSRRELFDQLGRRGDNILILTEGLVIYFTPDEASAFAQDLAAVKSFRTWIQDLFSPGLLKLLKERMGQEMGEGAVLKFGPAEGPAFFEKFGWKATRVNSTFKTAGKIKRLRFPMKLFAPLTPDAPDPKKPARTWGGVVQLERA